MHGLHLKQVCPKGAAETVDSTIGIDDLCPVQSGQAYTVKSGCLSYTILLNLNFWCDFFPVSIKSQYLDSTRPHKVSFVQLLLCCPVVLWVQLWK